jgi:hypothetical protein
MKQPRFIKSSRAISRVSSLKINVSGTGSIPIIITSYHHMLIMGTEPVPQMSIFNELTRLIARENFINVSRCESFNTLTTKMFYSCPYKETIASLSISQGQTAVKLWGSIHTFYIEMHGTEEA